MYDVAEASTLWTHVACKKSGNCYSEMDAYIVTINLSYIPNQRTYTLPIDSLPWQIPCEDLPVPATSTHLTLVNQEPVCNKERQFKLIMLSICE